MERPNPKAKRHLLDDLEGGPSSANKKSKTQKLDKNGHLSQNKSKTSTNKAVNPESKGKKNFTMLKKGNKKLPAPTKGKINKAKLACQNNNATVKGRSRANLGLTDEVRKVVPIIQTRGMKAKAAKINNNIVEMPRKVVVTQKEVNQLDSIDKLTSNEIVDGDPIVEDEVCHDGVELSINGSDIDEDFPEDQPNASTVGTTTNTAGGSDQEVSEGKQDLQEPGEISSSEDEYEPECGRVRSKVVKLSSKTKSDKFGKFSHLYQDPDFKQFLNEVIDERTSSSKVRKSSKSTKTKTRQ